MNPDEVQLKLNAARALAKELKEMGRKTVVVNGREFVEGDTRNELAGNAVLRVCEAFEILLAERRRGA